VFLSSLLFILSGQRLVQFNLPCCAARLYSNFNVNFLHEIFEPEPIMMMMMMMMTTGNNPRITKLPPPQCFLNGIF